MKHQMPQNFQSHAFAPKGATDKPNATKPKHQLDILETLKLDYPKRQTDDLRVSLELFSKFRI